MHSFSAYVFSWRMRLSTLKRHKLTTSLGVVFIIFLVVLGPTVYQESWFDPFSTLNVPNQKIHPHAITMLGILNADDPFHPYYYTDRGKIQELMYNLQRATLLSSEQDLGTLENQKIQFFTLHRAPSRYHSEEDYALKYYPEKGIVRFGQQAFRINEATIYNLTQIAENRIPGWWK